MAGDKILVLGGTGLAGVCLIRELLHRQHGTVVFARNPAKLPEEFVSNKLLEVVKGEMTDKTALSNAISKCHTIISFLGPVNIRQPASTEYADYYRAIFPLMRQHGVRRIFAMATLSIYAPEDKGSVTRAIFVTMVRLLASGPYHNLLSIREPFEDKKITQDIDWTLFRIGSITGGSDLGSWKQDREQTDVYAGPLGGAGWTSAQKRASLTRWLVDASETGASEWIGRMPAVSRRA
ncbi:hypothetical protein J3E69DRAFT_374199 [Trichoderma sp. SZMC 28015]